MADRRTDTLRHFLTLLRRWQGADASMHDMTASHRTLRLFLRLPGRNGHLSIACIDPLHIHAPIAWSSAEITITVDDQDGFLVHDTKAGVRIQTGGVEVKEFD